MNTPFYCPYCTSQLQADTPSGEEFSCACGAMVDILDWELAMVSLPPHREIQILATDELTFRTPVPAHQETPGTAGSPAQGAGPWRSA